MILYDYFRSSASYRVRLALKIKKVAYKSIPVPLTEHLHNQAEYMEVNPQQLVPCLDIDGKILSQSLAIIDYLEDTYPTPPLFPSSPLEKAQVKSLMLFIACDMHPLNNLRVREHLQLQFNASENQITDWCQHWLQTGFERLEAMLDHTSEGQFCYGYNLSAADLCLIPQIYSATRFGISLKPYPLIDSINKHCNTLPVFIEEKP